MASKNKVKRETALSIVEKIKKKPLLVTLLLFGLILLLGLYLRFYLIQDIMYFGFDQGRDANIVRDILNGKFTLIGPRTGIGNLNLGPIYYYLLAPFYALTNLDPKGAIYFSIIANIFNFSVLFLVSKKIFNIYAAFFIIIIYAFSEYFILENRTPWNVSLMVGFAALIFYSIYQVYNEKYKWLLAAWCLAGFYFNIHFTAVFLPLILFASVVFVKNKKKVLRYTLLGLPLYFIWFIPNIIFLYNNSGGEIFKFQEFLKNYYIGFHLRFMLFRAGFVSELLEIILKANKSFYLKYIIPAIFFVLTFFITKNKKDKILAYLISLWFLVPLFGFTIYGGSISAYYFLFQVPAILFMLWYLVNWFYKLKPKITIVFILAFLVIFIYTNTIDQWIKTPSTSSSLNFQKQVVKNQIMSGVKPKYDKDPDRGVKIEPYLYTIWTIDGKRW